MREDQEEERKREEMKEKVRRGRAKGQEKSISGFFRMNTLLPVDEGEHVTRKSSSHASGLIPELNFLLH